MCFSYLLVPLYLPCKNTRSRKLSSGFLWTKLSVFGLSSKRGETEYMKQFKSNARSLEMDSSNRHEEQLPLPHLSGSYIRSLVKQLTSSSTMAKQDDPSKPLQINEQQQHQQQQKQKPRQAKKQVRRRLHTTRPYQERLFNMAEARREIVAALKLHRASVKQQQQQQQQEQEQSLTPITSSASQLSPQPLLQDATFPDYYLHGTCFSPFSWNRPSVPPMLGFPLPDQPLGLNLNLQSFINLHNQASMKPSSSSLHASSLSCMNSSSSDSLPAPAAMSSSLPLHLAMDDEEMAEIQSIGEQHDMEWNDRLNVATSAWWSKFLNSMEADAGADGDHKLHARDELLDMSSKWLNDGVGVNNAKETGTTLFHQQLDIDYFQVEDYLQDAGALESLDTGEIGYGERGWLS